MLIKFRIFRLKRNGLSIKSLLKPKTLGHWIALQWNSIHSQYHKPRCRGLTVPQLESILSLTSKRLAWSLKRHLIKALLETYQLKLKSRSTFCLTKEHLNNTRLNHLKNHQDPIKEAEHSSTRGQSWHLPLYWDRRVNRLLLEETQGHSNPKWSTGNCFWNSSSIPPTMTNS